MHVNTNKKWDYEQQELL